MSGSVVSSTERIKDGIKWKNNDPPSPSFTLKAINGTKIKIMMIMITCHLCLEIGRSCGIKVVKGTCRKTTVQVIK